MTGKTWVSNIHSQFHFKGGVRIRMATVTVLKLVMWLPGMTFIASGNNLLFAHHWRVPSVAVQAAYGCLMFAAFTVNSFLNLLMALYTVRKTKLSRLKRCFFLCITFFLA
jgi:hypothetical protein